MQVRVHKLQEGRQNDLEVRVLRLVEPVGVIDWAVSRIQNEVDLLDDLRIAADNYLHRPLLDDLTRAGHVSGFCKFSE